MTGLFYTLPSVLVLLLFALTTIDSVNEGANHIAIILFFKSD